MGLDMLDWVLIGLLTAAVIFTVLFLLYLFSLIIVSRKIGTIKNQRPKKKKNQKKWVKKVKKVQKQREIRVKLLLIFLILGIACAGSGFYVRYHQMTNLMQGDSDALVQGYFLLDGIEEQLNSVPNAESISKVNKTLYDLSARLASYGTNIPDSRLSKEGKLVLRRLYQSMKELGLNLTSINEQTLQNSEIVSDYLSDIKKVKTNQKEAFKYFRINESSLKQDT